MQRSIFYNLKVVRARGYAAPRSKAYTLHFVHVIFGSPGKNCAGSGICKAAEIGTNLFPPGFSKTSCKEGIAKVKAIRPDRLVFYFLICTMCRRLVQQYFDDGIFLVESDTTLELTKDGQTVSHFISSGTYPVIRNERYLIVHFHPDG